MWKIGGLISRGVYTVSGPFHPFGGAVDIIVVEQPDGSFKSSPWHVRFGKFQGVLKAIEREVSVNVNGVDADFHMSLDNRGEAFFLHEEGDACRSSEDEMDFKDVELKSSPSDKEVLGFDGGGDSGRRGRIFGLSFGRKSMKKNGVREGGSSVEVERDTSLERAEIAADLLEVRWTTNLSTARNVDVDSLKECYPKLPVAGIFSEVEVGDGSSVKDPLLNSDDESKDDFSMTRQVNGETDEDCENSVETYVGTDNGIMDDNKGFVSFGEDQSISTGRVSQGGSVLEFGNRTDKDESFLCPDTESENIDNGRFNGDEKIFCDVVAEDQKNEVTEDVFSDLVLNLENSTIVGTSSCASSSNNELRSEDLSDLGFEECLGNFILEKNTNATPLEDTDEQQFCFSDLDYPKYGKVEGIEAFSPGGVRDSLESIEEELNEAFTGDDKLNQLTDKQPLGDLLIDHPSLIEKLISETRPISISKAYKRADLEILAPVVNSLPNMPLAGDNINAYDVSQQLSRSLDSKLEVLKLVNDDVLVSLESGAAEQPVAHATNSSQISDEIKKSISDPAVEVSLCRHLLYEGMGYEAAALAFDAEKLDKDNFFSLCPDIMKDDKLVVRIGGLYFPWTAGLPVAAAIGSQGREQIMEPKGMIAVGQVNRTSEEVSKKPMNSRNGSWRRFRFPFKRSNTARDKNFEREMALENSIQMGRNTEEAGKKKIWTKSPTSEQLASLNLKEGKNVVIFTFSTAMLGNQQVDARIFLWKWNSQIVISDVDGTITKSDVLGQFMPLMGIDWSHTGVAHLFSAVKENGYHFLFLSARSIAQAYLTRQFLVNLKQDGKALPEGPIVISPDGLFPSLYREVIRRAPHEFKIACLEEIKALFPKDHSPFYAGFGNRDTDEVSYLKVGIPKGKIFTINPKGQVVVNRRVDTKSYGSLHTLVHNMFPPTTVREQEDYNSWNFWRLPPSNNV